MTPTDPIDQTHRESIEATRVIRNWVERYRARIYVWEPRPYPGGNPK